MAMHISTEGWEFVENQNSILGSGPSFIMISGSNGHSAIVQKTIFLGHKAKNLLLVAFCTKYDKDYSDIRIGIKPKWGHWSGRNESIVSPMCRLESSDENVVLQIQFGGESGFHSCKITNIELAYEPVEPEPEPPPDLGIAGQLAEIHQEIRGITEQIKLHLDQLEVRVREIDKLMAEDKKAHDWVDTYNRSIK